MKNILKNLFAALLLAGFAVTAQAKEEKADELGNKIALEIMQELIEQQKAGAKEPTEEEIGRLMLKKMQEHLAEFKSAMTEDCLQEYGKEKSKQCQCVTDNLDYKGSFALLEKQLSGGKPEEIEKESAEVIKKEKAVYESCGLEYHEEEDSKPAK